MLGLSCLQPIVSVIMLLLASDAHSDEIVNIIKMIATNQQQTAKDVKKLLSSIRMEYDTVQPSKRTFVSALVC